MRPAKPRPPFNHRSQVVNAIVHASQGKEWSAAPAAEYMARSLPPPNDAAPTKVIPGDLLPRPPAPRRSLQRRSYAEDWAPRSSWSGHARPLSLVNPQTADFSLSESRRIAAPGSGRGGFLPQGPDQGEPPLHRHLG